MSDPTHRTIIVGAGISGLTAAAYLAKARRDVLVLEKNKACGGLLNSFQREGFTFDAGPRSILNSGILRPMFAQLDINLELGPSPVSIGVEGEIIHLTPESGLSEYMKLLENLYPESKEDIQKIVSKIKGIMKDMAILYGIDNPFFKDLKNDKKYVFTELLPWVGKFLFMLYRMNHQNEPVESFLEKLTANRSLVDIIAQHFFKKTPTFFALGYFYAYTDYIYPKGGTGQIPKALVEKITNWGGKIQNETLITEIIPAERIIKDAKGTPYRYDTLVWCADLKTLYRLINVDGLNGKVSRNIENQKGLFLAKRGCDSVFSLFVGVNEPLETFKKISNGHFFYTPSRKGLGELHKSMLDTLIENFETTSKDKVMQWLDEYCRLTTYEISIPALRDPSLTPNGKTGLVISMLFEYNLMKQVQTTDWYPEFKAGVENRMLETLSTSIYPGLQDNVIFKISSSPLTIENVVGSSEGALVGWSYESAIPVAQTLQQIANAPKTPIPNVYQAGQWSYSPAGIPTAILTGFYAAKKVLKRAT